MQLFVTEREAVSKDGESDAREVFTAKTLSAFFVASSCHFISMQSPCFSIESVVSVSSKFVLFHLTLLVIIFYSLCRSTEASTC